ncbi:MAG: rRNA maturation RNase YbeY [Actinomycetota bacterium]|nr:rRNA maturation RNase YbeY [Actinomycetota bacterium]
MKVSLIDNQDKVKLDMDLLKKVSEYVSGKFDRDPKSHLNIIFSSTEKIRELNKKYRKVDSGTDVLSFSYITDKEDISPVSGLHSVTIGEIFICPEVADSNISDIDNDWNLTLELIMLIIHGILHIYNYDHIKEKDRVSMEGIQDSILSDVKRTFGL